MKVKKIPNQWKFLIVVAAIYLTAFWLSEDFFWLAMGDFWKTLEKVLPIIGLVFFIMFFLNLFLNPEIIKKHLGKDSGWKGWIYAVIGSIAISGPPYVLMPMISDLRKHGMKTELAAVFLSNRSVQPVFLPVMAHYFGLTYAILVSFLIIIFSVWNGWVVGKYCE